MIFEGFPFIIGWELTLACNLRCFHCGSSAGTPRIRELTLEESLAICDQFPSLLVQEVNFTGGEPLLRPDWPEIAAYLRDLSISTKILTNGYNLSRNTIGQMKEVGISGLGVSLDGCEETHDYIRKHNGLFSRVITGIERALNAELPLTVITTVNSLNLNELPILFDLLRALGVCRWQIQPIFPLGRVHEVSDLCLTEQAYMQLGGFVKNYLPKAKDVGLELLPSDSFGYFTEYDMRDPSWRGCPAGLFSCGITSDGRIKGCLSLPDDIVEGDLRQNDLWEIWFHPNSFSYSRQFSRNDLGSACYSCDKAELCHGGCSAMSYGSTTRFHNDPYCFYGLHMRNSLT